LGLQISAKNLENKLKNILQKCNETPKWWSHTNMQTLDNFSYSVDFLKNDCKTHLFLIRNFDSFGVLDSDNSLNSNIFSSPPVLLDIKNDCLNVAMIKTNTILADKNKNFYFPNYCVEKNYYITKDYLEVKFLDESLFRFCMEWELSKQRKLMLLLLATSKYTKYKLNFDDFLYNMYYDCFYWDYQNQKSAIFSSKTTWGRMYYDKKILDGLEKILYFSSIVPNNQIWIVKDYRKLGQFFCESPSTYITPYNYGFVVNIGQKMISSIFNPNALQVYNLEYGRERLLSEKKKEFEKGIINQERYNELIYLIENNN
jgi:hypothetical protein